MNLSIAREDFSIGAEQQGRVVGTPLAVDPLEDRPRLEMNAELAGEAGKPIGRRPGDLLRGRRFLLARSAPAEDFGQHDQRRAARRRITDEALGLVEVRSLIGTGRHLNGSSEGHGDWRSTFLRIRVQRAQRESVIM